MKTCFTTLVPDQAGQDFLPDDVRDWTGLSACPAHEDGGKWRKHRSDGCQRSLPLIFHLCNPYAHPLGQQEVCGRAGASAIQFFLRHLLCNY